MRTTSRVSAFTASFSKVISSMVNPQLHANGRSAPGRYFYSSRNGGQASISSPFLTRRSTTTPSALHQYHSTANANNDEKDRICAPRASRAVELLPSYLADCRAVKRFCPENAPDGALQLGVAENKMLEDLLIPSLMEMYSTQDFPADAIYYQPTHGRESLRVAFSHYLEGLLQLSGKMDPDGIVVGAGCNAVLENLCLCLAAPGEGVMIPTPYYAAFEFDLVARAGKSSVSIC